MDPDSEVGSGGVAVSGTGQAGGIVPAGGPQIAGLPAGALVLPPTSPQGVQIGGRALAPR